MYVRQLNVKVKLKFLERTFYRFAMSPSNLMADKIQLDGNKPPQTCCFPLEQHGH